MEEITMVDMEAAYKKMAAYRTYRERHGKHVEGDTLYFKLDHHDKYVFGVVKQVIQHYSMTYYLLEVEVPVIGEAYLDLRSQYQVLSKEEVEAKGYELA